MVMMGTDVECTTAVTVDITVDLAKFDGAVVNVATVVEAFDVASVVDAATLDIACQLNTASHTN